MMKWWIFYTLIYTLIFAVGIAFIMFGLHLIFIGPDSLREVTEPINRWIQTFELNAFVLTGALLLFVGISLCRRSLSY